MQVLYCKMAKLEKDPSSRTSEKQPLDYHQIPYPNKAYIQLQAFTYIFRPMPSLSPLLLLLLLPCVLCQDLSAIYSQLANLQLQMTQLQNRKPQVIRIAPFDLSQSITLHQQTSNLELVVPMPPNTNVYGLLVQIYYYHASTNSASPGSHGYLSTKMKQRNDAVNTVQTISRHFNWYANTATELEIVPWSMSNPNILEAYLFDTYNTESPGNTYGKNYFRIRLVGYLAY